MDYEYYKKSALSLLKIILGLIIGIFITSCFPPLILLDILLIPALLYFIFMLIVLIPVIMIRDFLFPNRFKGACDDDSYTESLNDEDKHNTNIPTTGDLPITGDHFFPRKDGFCINEYSEACQTCARRKKSFGNYTMGYHCHM